MIKSILCGIGKVYRGLVFREAVETSNIRRIAFLKIGAIGDVVMTTPLVRTIRNCFSHAHISYYVGKWSASVLEGNTHIDSIISFDESIVFGGNIVGLLKLARRIRQGKFDCLFVLDTSYLAGLFGALCGVPVRCGFDREGEGFANTICARYGK